MNAGQIPTGAEDGNIRRHSLVLRLDLLVVGFTLHEECQSTYWSPRNLCINCGFIRSFQRVDGCVCINPGHLTKKAGGGTFTKISIPDQLPGIKPDLSSDIGVQIVYIWVFRVPITAQFAIYTFCACTYPVYVGETDSLSFRLYCQTVPIATWHPHLSDGLYYCVLRFAWAVNKLTSVRVVN